VQEAQHSVTSGEFIEWIAFEELRLEQAKPEHYYLARIVMEVRALFHKNPRDLRLEDFMLKFNRDQKEQAQQEAAQSKTIWAGIAARLGFRKRDAPPEFIK
jgi:hypothetical protein